MVWAREDGLERTLSSFDKATPEILNYLVAKGEGLLEKNVSTVNLENGKFESYKEETNAQALSDFAKKLSQEKRLCEAKSPRVQTASNFKHDMFSCCGPEFMTLWTDILELPCLIREFMFVKMVLGGQVQFIGLDILQIPYTLCGSIIYLFITTNLRPLEKAFNNGFSFPCNVLHETLINTAPKITCRVIYN
ncbi:acyl transferase/acyl hydrolase/lysophospholipase [Artemisia annua]|uniref:Acyl transferase/acyl hydrolase/lysophospholipase n=1 Tax=Artemisia annua TaxID=35608 RepID=A0A2U1QBJ1_ARTAN|nr:acyl transferase/acyl hydrolase/lysophospholipase [Artemisia annua]